MWIGFPVLGALLGLAVRPLAERILDSDRVPDLGPARFIAELPQPQGTIAAVAAVGPA